jgi:hypothetical protein
MGKASGSRSTRGTWVADPRTAPWVVMWDNDQAAPPSITSSTGSQRNQPAAAAMGRSVVVLTRAAATRPSRTTLITPDPAANSNPALTAPASVSGLGPIRATILVARTQPASEPTSAGTAISNRAFTAIGPGPMPLAASSRISPDRRSTQ